MSRDLISHYGLEPCVFVRTWAFTKIFIINSHHFMCNVYNTTHRYTSAKVCSKITRNSLVGAFSFAGAVSVGDELAGRGNTRGIRGADVAPSVVY